MKFKNAINHADIYDLTPFRHKIKEKPNLMNGTVSSIGTAYKREAIFPVGIYMPEGRSIHLLKQIAKRHHTGFNAKIAKLCR